MYFNLANKVFRFYPVLRIKIYHIRLYQIEVHYAGNAEPQKLPNSCRAVIRFEYPAFVLRLKFSIILSRV